MIPALMRFVRIAIAVMVLGSQLAVTRSFGQSRSIPGIAFVVDTSPDIVPPGLHAEGPTMFKSLGLRVTYAGSRGRVDVLAAPTRPAFSVDSVVFASWLAASGDYYLFDSTAFILVRPSAKEFFAFRLGDASFNYAGRRDGWPAFFALKPTVVATIRDRTASLLSQHGEFPIFWHLDLVRDTVCVVGACSIEELARGRTPIADAPAEEVSVVRWFGPAQALAEVFGGVARLIGKPMRLTTVSGVTALHRLLDLQATTVDAERLTLPRDYKEMPWPGFTRAAHPPMLSADGGAKWRAWP